MTEIYKNNLQKVVNSLTDEQAFNLLVEFHEEKDQLPSTVAKFTRLLEERLNEWSAQLMAEVATRNRKKFHDRLS
jgi:DNA recombination-dependent growth factor C